MLRKLKLNISRIETFQIDRQDESRLDFPAHAPFLKKYLTVLHPGAHIIDLLAGLLMQHHIFPFHFGGLQLRRKFTAEMWLVGVPGGEQLYVFRDKGKRTGDPGFFFWNIKDPYYTIFNEKRIFPEKLLHLETFLIIIPTQYEQRLLNRWDNPP